MGDEPPKATRKPRADSLRNRERLLTAAAEIFRTGGPEASLEAVARRADVGIGTLYRHFPTREALFEAVYRREVGELADLAVRLSQDGEPVEALRRWLHANVQLVATKKGMLAAMALAANAELYTHTYPRLLEAVGSLIGRAVAAGAIRDDVSAEDLIRTLIGMCHMHDQPGWETTVLRMVDVFVDGMRLPPRA